MLGELIETAEASISTQALPYLTGTFAGRAVAVIANPLHAIYPKLNKFLIKAPTWISERLPSYWVEKVIQNPPDDDEAYHRDVQWLLDFLYDGLRTPEASDFVEEMTKTLTVARILRYSERVVSMSAYCHYTAYHLRQRPPKSEF